ncbi:MAG TPA: FHA domain-containing protein [Chthonomonadaceae bacterium]|nr:FHA domain-containing protein [Chthonomonadaceae bacterium]
MSWRTFLRRTPWHTKHRPLILLAALAICGLPAYPAQAQQSGPSAPAKTAPSRGTTGENSGDTATAKTDKTAGKAASSAPAPTMQIKKEAPGDFFYHFLGVGNVSSAPAPLPASTGSDNVVALALPPDIKPHNAQLEIIDLGKGNVARLPVTTKGVTSVTADSFQYVQTLSVPVQSGGKGVYGALVTVTDGKTLHDSHLLTQADNGVARFEDVPITAPVTVTVLYGAHPSKSMTQTLTLNHPADGYHWQTMDVDWPDAMTISPPPAAARTEPMPVSGSPSEPASGSAANWVANMIISLLCVAALAYGIYWAYTTGRIKGLLDNLGIPQQPAPAGGPSAPNPFAKPEKPPIQSITEGTADPLIAGVGAGPGVSAAPVVAGSGPRLVGTMGTYSGNVFPLNGAGVDIGREPGNSIALPQDSNVSRRHATLQGSGGQYAIIDHNSSNGTFVNGVRIPSETPQPLRPGDEVQIGMTRFRFEA